MDPTRNATIGSACVVGIAAGLVVGLGLCFPAHDYLFALPGGLSESAWTILARATSGLGLPVGRGAGMLAIHGLLGACVGVAVGAPLAVLAPRARVARPLPLALLAALALTLLVGATFRHRGVSSGAGQLLVVAVTLAAIVPGVTFGLLAIAAAARRRRRAAGIAALVGLAAAGVSIARAPRVVEAEAGGASALAAAAAPPLLLIGLDAASWANFEPLVREGTAPHLAELRARGGWGHLQSLEPTLSPVIWTTIVTGRRPGEHGILDFTRDGVPYTSNSRTAWALWEILPRFGGATAFHYWWASWPAEHVAGRIVTDRLDQVGLDDRVYPAQELPRLEAIAEEARARAPMPSDLLGAGADAPALFERHPVALDVLERFLQRDEVVTSLGEAALRERRFRLVGVYLRVPDAMGHKFWRWHYAQRSPWLARWLYGEPDADQEALGPIVDASNRIVDGNVGRLIAAAGPDINVVVVSDHGMTATVPLGRNAAEPETGVHHRAGLIAMAGPSVREGVRLRGASVYDVFPTVLYLLGAPVPDDLPGRVLTEAIRAEVLRDRPLTRVTSFGDRPQVDPTPIPSGADELIRNQLRDLGYVVD